MRNLPAGVPLQESVKQKEVWQDIPAAQDQKQAARLEDYSLPEIHPVRWMLGREGVVAWMFQQEFELIQVLMLKGSLWCQSPGFG